MVYTKWARRQTNGFAFVVIPVRRVEFTTTNSLQFFAISAMYELVETRTNNKSVSH